MEMQQIGFDYFYRIFLEECTSILYEKQLENYKNKISDYVNIREFAFGFFDGEICNKDERLEIYNKVLHSICINYLSLSKYNLDIIPIDVFEFVDLILNNMHDNEYKESFLTSLQFIYQNYLEALELGRPMLWSTIDNDKTTEIQKNKIFNVVLDSDYNILDFDSENLDLLEQDKIINKIVMMEYNKILGPIENVLIKVRKNI